MDPSRPFTAADEGKRVVTADGEPVGRVVRVVDGTAHVRPRPGLFGGCGSWLTETWGRADCLPLDPRCVDRIGADRVVLGPPDGDRDRPGRGVESPLGGR
jgi:hypothetical protein